MSVLGPTVEERKSMRIAAAAHAAPDGPIPPELDRLRHDRVLHHVSFLGSAQIIALLFLMSVKPGLAGSLLTIAVAAVLSQLIAAIAQTGSRQPATPEPASAPMPPETPAGRT